MIKPAIELLRIPHWIKNLFIFAPLFFGAQMLEVSKVIDVTMAFFAFSLSASSIYIFNDYKDRFSDKEHPTKKERPLASGRISPGKAISLGVTLVLISLLWSFIIKPEVGYVVLAYVGINIFYSISLKHYSIIDISIIAIGFILRIWAGGLVSEIELSHWLIIMIYLLSLFLALAKRRDDLVLIDSDNKKRTIRKSIDGYNLEFVNNALAIISTLIIVCYTMYVTSNDIIERFSFKYLYISLIFVITGLLRYLQLTYIENKSGSPTDVLLRDSFIKWCVILWGGFFFYIIYLH